MALGPPGSDACDHRRATRAALPGVTTGGRSHLGSLILSLKHPGTPASIGVYRRLLGRQMNLRGLFCTVIRNPEKRKVGGSTPALTTSKFCKVINSFGQLRGANREALTTPRQRTPASTAGQPAIFSRHHRAPLVTSGLIRGFDRAAGSPHRAPSSTGVAQDYRLSRGRSASPWRIPGRTPSASAGTRRSSCRTALARGPGADEAASAWSKVWRVVCAALGSPITASPALAIPFAYVTLIGPRCRQVRCPPRTARL